MIVVTRAFSGVLDAWLASLGKTRPRDDDARPGALTLARWAQEVHAAIALAPGPARGLEIGTHLQLQHAGALGYLAVNTRTFGELLDTYMLLEKWFYGRNWVRLQREGGQPGLAWDRAFGLNDRVLEQLHLSALLTLMRCACPTLPPLRRADMMSAAQGESAAYRAAFGCPVRFRQDSARLVFTDDALQTPVDLRGAALGPVWHKRQRTLREAMPGATEFVRAVQGAITHTLPGGANADAVAARMNLSRRTLQRRLMESGCSYRQLVDGLRERHARQLLHDPGLSLKEVAFLLGYSEQSAFNHAYLRWNQRAPRSKLMG